MGVIVQPDYNTFLAIFPEFGSLSADQYGFAFDFATQFCRNDGCGPVSKASIQSRLLNLMTAHWAYLLYGTDQTGGAPQLVGAINSATEGSVSVGTKNDYPPGTVQWYQQTKYGSAFWAATAPYRQAIYVPGPVNTGDVVGPFNGPYPYGPLGSNYLF